MTGYIKSFECTTFSVTRFGEILPLWQIKTAYLVFDKILNLFIEFLVS